jgi:hypothetical protein
VTVISSARATWTVVKFPRQLAVWPILAALSSTLALPEVSRFRWAIGGENWWRTPKKGVPLHELLPRLPRTGVA